MKESNRKKIEKIEPDERIRQVVGFLRSLGFPLIRIRKSLHKLTGITQPEIARRVSVSRQAISFIIDGRTTTSKYQEAISEFWGMPVDELFADCIKKRTSKQIDRLEKQIEALKSSMKQKPGESN